MRVTHVITGLNRGGAENSLFRLIGAQGDPAQHSVISLLDGGIYRTRIEELGVRVASLGMKRGLPSLPALLRLRRLIQEWQPDLVQTWMYHADLLGGLAAKRLDLPICWGIRNGGLAGETTRWSTRTVARLCALVSRRIPDLAISCSHRAVEACRLMGYRNRFRVVPNGLDLEAWQAAPGGRAAARRELGVSDDTLLLAYAGRADPQKDHPNLAGAFTLLHERQPHSRLLLCGAGLEADSHWLHGLPFSAAAREALIPLGPRDDLPRLWQGIDMLLLSSLSEAFPNVLIEAMAAGVPCVSTDVGDAAEIVGDTGLVVPPGQPEALAAAIEKLIALGPEGSRALGEAARARVAQRYTLEQMVQGYQEAWTEVLQARGRV